MGLWQKFRRFVRGTSSRRQQSTRSPTQDGAQAGPSTDASAVIQLSQEEARHSNPSSTRRGGVASPSTDSSEVIEGSQWQGTQSKPSSAQEGAAALQSTDTPAVLDENKQQIIQPISNTTHNYFGCSVKQYHVSNSSHISLGIMEESQRQGRQSNPFSAQEGAAALQSTDTAAVLEENQQQEIQSISNTTDNYCGCSVSKNDLSHSSHDLLGNAEHRSCVSQASLSIRIKLLNEVFQEIRTLHTAEDLLKRHNHVTVCGAPGDGKTSIALKICEIYLKKKYDVVFVDSIEDFEVDTIIQRQRHLLIVFDDIFGSVTFPSYLQKIKKVLTALADALVDISVQKEQHFKKKREQKKLNADKKNNGALPTGDTKAFHKLRFVFTSRSFNWKEGCNRLHQFKINLFKPESIIDMTTTTLTTKEKESILNSFWKRHHQEFDISIQDKNKITQLQDNMFGYPLICQLYCNNPAFHMHKITDFFQNPVSYLRGDLDTIIREGSSRSAALVLLVLCGGKLNLASFKSGTTCAALFQVVKEEIASCSRTDIGKEISNFTGTYCTVENHVASFSHPSIHDAAACALCHLNDVLLLKHCSLQFLHERVRLKPDRDDGFQSTHIDDVTNMIYITSNIHEMMITRLVQGVREGCFRWTVGHPIFNNDTIASSFFTQMIPYLPHVVNRNDSDSGECFLYWVSLSTNSSLFERSVSLRESDLSNSAVTDFYDGIIGCIQTGNLLYLQRIAAALKQRPGFNVDRRTKDHKTLLMIAAEAGQLDVFNWLLKEGADVSATDSRHCNCLHHSCKSGSKAVVQVIIEQFQHLVNAGDADGNTPAMLCAESGQMEILKLLVTHKAGVTTTNSDMMNCFHIGCTKGHISVVEYLLKVDNVTKDMRGGRKGQTSLLMAAERGHYGVYNLLVSEGADLSLTDNNNRDCLMYACEGGNLSIVKHHLFLKTFDINRQGGYFNESAVMVAAGSGHYDVYDLLVSEGADLTLTDNNNSDCLMYACEGGNLSIVKHLLFLKTFDINRQGCFNQSAVMVAAESGHYDVYDLLVSEGADLSLTDEHNSDCLMLACEGGNLSIVKHLLSLKTFDINRQGGCSNQSAVMVAAESGHYDVYNLLVSEGADLSLTDEYNMNCLMLACEGGNLSIVKHLLSLKTFDINRQRGYFNRSAVMVAAESGHYDVYNLLVSEGADLSLTDEYNMNCLMLACQGGNLSIVKHLLSLKTFDIKRQGGCFNISAVMVAAERGHYDVYDLLVSEGADLSLTDNNNSDCLMYACHGGNLSIVKHLLSLKTFDINRQGGCFNKSAVMVAAESGHYDVYDLLVSEGADLSLTDNNNSDCLMYACHGGNLSIVKHLLSLKTFDINRQGGCFNKSAVMVAAESGHYDVYNLLVSEGADLSLTDKHNSDCLMYACKGGNQSIVKHLLSLKTFDINRQGGCSNQSAVMVAAERGHYDVYNLLVSEGADLSLTDKHNSDCLMYACEGGKLSIVKHLLSLKTFDINRQRGCSNQSAVMVAAESGHYDVYNLLVSEGADLSLTDKHNSDCLMLACEGGNLSIVKHLLSLKTFDINRQGGCSNQSAVMVAVESGHYDLYNLLVSEGADLSLTDEDNKDCLMYACKGGNQSIVKHLLSLKTFDINRQGGYSNESAVMVAAESGHYDVYNLLVSEGADLSLTDEDNSDCLMYACEGGNLSIVKHLLSLKTFDINRQGGYFNKSAVIVAAQRGHYDVYNLLVSEGADLSLTDEHNNDCLMYACEGGNLSIVKHLLSLKTFDINRQGGYFNKSAVMVAAQRGHYDVYNLLVSEGADLSLTDEDNSDCLMYACEGGNPSIVKHLLSLKTFDINRQGGYFNKSAVMVAAESGHYDVYNLLVSEGADLSLTDDGNRDCLIYVREVTCS